LGLLFKEHQLGTKLLFLSWFCQENSVFLNIIRVLGGIFFHRHTKITQKYKLLIGIMLAKDLFTNKHENFLEN
jgi:hypothetical protein